MVLNALKVPCMELATKRKKRREGISGASPASFGSFERLDSTEHHEKGSSEKVLGFSFNTALSTNPLEASVLVIRHMLSKDVPFDKQSLSLCLRTVESYGAPKLAEELLRRSLADGIERQSWMDNAVLSAYLKKSAAWESNSTFQIDTGEKNKKYGEEASCESLIEFFSTIPSPDSFSYGKLLNCLYHLRRPDLCVKILDNMIADEQIVETSHVNIAIKALGMTGDVESW